MSFSRLTVLSCLTNDMAIFKQILVHFGQNTDIVSISIRMVNLLNISLNCFVMKKYLSLYLVAAMSLLSLQTFSQSDEDTTALLGLPGDNLDLYGVLTLFQKSKTIEDFEKSLNEQKTGLNNLD